ncbi:unnamed protein product [Caretta caretta]
MSITSHPLCCSVLGAKKQRVKQSRDRLCWDPPSHARRAARRHSIRQLLCDNADCTLCNKAARQAERLVYADRAGAWVPAGPGSPPPPASGPKGRNLLDSSIWRGLDVLQWCRSRTCLGDRVLPPAPEPFPPSKSRSTPERQAGSRQTERRPPGEDEEGLPRPQQAEGSSREREECLCCSSLWDETLLRRQEQAQSFSSSHLEPAHHSWEQAQSSLSSQPEPAHHSWEQAQSSSSSQPEPAHHSWEQAQSSSSSQPEPAHHSWEQAQSSSSSQPEPAHHRWEQAQSSSSSQPEPAHHRWEQAQSSLSSQPEPAHHSWEQAQSSSSSQPEPALHSWEQAQSSLSSQPEPAHHSWEQAQSSSSSQPEPALHSWEQAQSSLSGQLEPALRSWEQPQSSSSSHYTASHISWDQEQNVPWSQQEPFLRSWELAPSSSSLQHEPPLFTWELRTGSSQHKTFLPRHEEHPGPSPAQHEPFPPSQGEHGWGGSFLCRDRARSPQAAPQRQAHHPGWVPFLAQSPGGARMSRREAKQQRDQDSVAPRAPGEALMSLAGRPPARGSPGALRLPGRIELAEAETPFLQGDVRASLERHVQVKRLQHTLGLPCILQSALKIFVPPAPKPAARRPVGAGRVVTMSQALPFLSVGSRLELERHLQRMVQLKRWGLPRRIQESLKLLMPATPLRPRLSPLPSGRWAPKGPGPVTGAAQTSGLRTRAPARPSRLPTRASESTPGLHCCRDTRELQGHIAKKGLEIRLGALPAVLRSSQQMAALGRRDLLLPKLIPPGHKAPLSRHRLGPLLRHKAGSVELNVRHKHIQYLWALPTLYAESLAKMVPCPPGPPAPLLPLGTAVEFCPLETPFMAPEGRELLERQVLRKRLQHEWGLPGLVRRSLRHFMPPPPARPRPKGSVRPAAMELCVSSGAPPIPLATKRELEAHIQRRVAKRRWGLPRRVRESLRGFMPPMTAAPGTRPDTQGRRASRPLRGLSARRAPRESPSRGAPGGPMAVAVSLARPLGTAWSQHTCHQLLERHVTRKNIEIRLGLIPRRAQHSQEAACRGGKLPLPRLIRPGQRSLELRPRELLFLEQAASDRLELNLLHKHLSYRWGLPTLYRQSLAKLFHAGPTSARPPSSYHKAGTTFMEQELPFLPLGAREALELHIKRRKLQHEWGLPLIIQKSLQGLMAAAPRPSQPKAPLPAARDVAILQAELPFLSEGSRRELELSLRKRLMHRRWGLPRRIQESVRLLQPASPRTEFGPRSPAEKEARGHLLLPWHKSDMHLERGVGKARRVVAAPRPRLSLGRDAQERLQIHVAKKCVETRLGAIPTAVRRSWQRLHLISRLPLPKRIPAGDRAPKARSPLLPFVHLEDVCHLELNVQHKRLTALWGLGTLYTQSLSRMVPQAPRAPVPSREAVVEFGAQEALFLGPEAREALELHVRKKRLQHEWGLPLIIQKSMRGLMAAAPRPSQPKAPLPAARDVAILQAELPFLSEGSRRELELSLRKRLMHRRWGLPRRIQESVRLLQPASPRTEFGPRSPAEKEARGHLLLPWHKSDMHLERGVGKARRVVAAPRPRLSLGRDAQERLQIHVAKKCVETRLGAIPTAVRRSWQRLHLISRLPLPKRIPAGDRAPKARSPLLPFVHLEDVCHLELNVQHKRLTALWGLGTLYTQSLSRMVPRAPRAPVPSREAIVEFGVREALFLGLEAREALELHVRKKRLQHEWGFPALIERSLRAFVPEPLLPGPTAPHQRAELHVLILGQEPSLMDEDTRGRLERHLRKMMLQRRWGLPRRIQESLRLFAAFAPPAGPQLPGAGREGGIGRSQLEPSQPDVPAGSRLAGDGRTEGLAAERRDRLQRHLARKCLEIGLGVWPALVKRSQRVAREGERIRLPRLIPAGQKPPTPRAGSLLCLSPTAVDTLDMNVRHKQLAYFWGLPTLQAASLQRMMSKAPAAPLGSAAGRAWMQMSLAGSMGAKKPERNGYKEPPLVTGPPLLTAEARDQLESHILRKKLQHEWGLPRVVQRSLGAFTPPPPGRGPPRRVQAPARGSVAVGSLLFLRTETRERLELHVRRLALERRWGLPKRILESLRMFLPPAPPGAEPRGQTQLLLHVSHKPPQDPTAPSMEQSGELQPGPRETLTHQSQHWHEMGVKEGKASCPVAVPQHSLGSSGRRSQETSQTSDGEGPSGSPCHFPEDKTELKSTLDFPGKKVLGISHRAQASQRWASCPAADEPHPQQREQGSEESPRHWRTHDGEGAPRLPGTGGRSRTSSVETAVWNEKRISRKLESSFRRMVRSRSRHGPVGKQLLSLEIAGHLEMDHCTCLDCPCCKLEGQDGARTLGAGSPVWHTQCICARGSATLPGDTEAPSFLHAEPAWQGQGGPRAAKDEPSASSPSSLEGSESRVSDWSAGESAHSASRPVPDEPSLARVHLTPPRTAAHQLDIHLAQKALGSFILPPCVIRSQATYADMEAERLRAAAQEHRREMNIRLQRRRARKSQLGGPRQEALGERAHPMGTGQPGFPTAGSLGQRLIRESQSQANQYLCETCHGLFTAGEEGLSPPPCPAEGAGKSDVGRTQLDTRVCPRDRETSGDVCRGEQGAAYQQPQDLGRAAGTPLYEGLPGPEDGEGAGGQTWAPPTHHPQPVSRDDAGDRGSPAASDELVHTLSSSQWPASPSEQRPRSAEGLSQFSTEGEWEMVGDWDSEAVAAWDTEGAGSLGWKERRNTEGQHSMGEMPAEGTRPRPGTNMRQTEALVLTAALPRAEQPPRAPPGRGAEPLSVPCKGKGPTFRGIMLGFLKRVTSRASVGKREWVGGSVAAPRGAPPPPRKLAPSPKSVTFNAKVHVRAEVRRCQLCSSGEEMDGAGRKDPAAAAWSRGLPGNGAPQGAGAASTDTKRGERRRGSVTRGEEPSPEGTGPSAEYGGYQERMTLTVTKCREGKAHDHSGTPAEPTGPPAPWPPPPACPATRGTRTTGRHTGEGGGVTSLKAADPRQQGAGRAHGQAIRHVSTAGAFTSSQLDEQMVVIGLILEKKLGLRHGLYAWERSQRRRRALWGPGGRQEGAGAERAGDMGDTMEESQLDDGSCVARAHAGAGPAVEGAVRAKRTDVPQGPGTDLPWPAGAENPEPVRGHSSKRLQRQEHSAGVSESGSNQPSPRESSRAKPREQRGRRLSPSPPQGRARSPVEGPWGSGRARGADSRGIQALSREQRSSSRGRPTGRRTRSKSREGESLVREGVQDRQGARRRPGKASSHRVAPPASGVEGNATEDASGTVRASHLERHGHQAGVETQLPQPGSHPAKSTGHVCWFHQHHAHAHLRNVHDRTAALRRENLCALREKMQARRRKLSPSLNSAASEEESCLRALDQS